MFMAEKVYIRDEYFAAARALQVPPAAKPDQIENAYQERLKECADDARRKEELLHAKGILTGSLPTMEELVRYRTWKNKQLKGPAHSERPPTFFERARTAATRSFILVCSPLCRQSSVEQKTI
jgi:hypothetical protein